MTFFKEKENEKIKDWEESSIERHDLYNFESKIDYTLEQTEKKKTTYLLATYFFIPRSLQINKDSYSKENFFSDINNRIRFQTPKMSIEEILDEQNDYSPLITIWKLLKSLKSKNSNTTIITKIQREFCLLADVIKVTLRDQFNYILNNYYELKEQHDLLKKIKFYLESIKKLQLELELMESEVSIMQESIGLREAFQFAEEYISLQIEKWLTSIFKGLGYKINQETKKCLIELIEKEQEHHENIKSALIIFEDNENETFSYYEGIMKKYVQRVLYLEKKKKDPKSQSLEIFYSVAAGVAMFFSLFLGFLILSFFTKYSIPFIIATVVIYMLKDRIKENIRGISQKAVGSLFPDQHIDIVDGFNREKIGKSKEIVNFIIHESIPPEILNIRRSSTISSIEERGKPEEVILYEKKITLLNKKIKQFHTRRSNFSDVIRFNVRGFLRYADDPIQILSKWNKDEKKIVDIPISKVYHINLVLKLTSYKGKKVNKIQYKKYRVILDQRGIKRVLEPKFTL
ncbi:MAG: hypothetical protein R3255_07720 [Candidatus Lokiarchaeia archaeon]|nr:hypothetical protein [Candidatus Lokiarchaeia archaeon]